MVTRLVTARFPIRRALPIHFVQKNNHLIGTMIPQLLFFREIFIHHGVPFISSFFTFMFAEHEHDAGGTSPRASIPIIQDMRNEENISGKVRGGARCKRIRSRGQTIQRRVRVFEDTYMMSLSGCSKANRKHGSITTLHASRAWTIIGPCQFVDRPMPVASVVCSI